jgi:hypothetical protein
MHNIIYGSNNKLKTTYNFERREQLQQRPSDSISKFLYRKHNLTIHIPPHTHTHSSQYKTKLLDAQRSFDQLMILLNHPPEATSLL